MRGRKRVGRWRTLWSRGLGSVSYAGRDSCAFARHWDRLAEFFRVSTGDWKSVQWAWDKKKSYELAERLGIPAPRTYNIQNETELETLASRLPLAVKPAIKEHFFYATGAKAWRADSAEQLRLLYRKATKQIRSDEILLQEIIPGDGNQQYSYCAFFRNGRADGKLIARRLRQHPREFGRAATYVETTVLPEIEELAERFLRAIDYYGLVEVEFKKDPRDGAFKLLDVNARTWGFHALGSAAGVDFPYLQYADQVAQPVGGFDARPGVGWMRLVTDFPTVALDLCCGNLDLRSYWASLRSTRIESVFATDDVMPSIAEMAMLPYFVGKKCFARSPSGPRTVQATKTCIPAKVSANESW